MTSADATNPANAATATNPANTANAANAANTATPASPANAATPATPASSGTAAIILAGGRASRLDGAAKPLLEVGGRTLLDRAIAAVAGCDPIVVVGPPAPVPGEIVWTRETPEFGGPVAGIAAGLASTESADVFVLAADLPHAEDAVALLRRHPPLTRGEDGICLADESGRMQWLIGLYRTDALRRAVASLPAGGRDASIRSLLAGLAVNALPAGDLATDVDTWDDLERARATAQTERNGADTERNATDNDHNGTDTEQNGADTPARQRTGRGDDMTDKPQHLPVEALDEWTSAACTALGIDRASVDVGLLLDLARDVAHGVARPAAPLSAYLAGLAAGRAGGSREDTAAAVATITALAASWQTDDDES